MLANFIKAIFFVFVLALGWGFYFSVTYKVNPGLLVYGYEFIELNEKKILTRVFELVQAQEERDKLMDIDRKYTLTLNRCRIMPISNFIDRLRAREHYYVSYYSGNNSRNYEVYAKVYVYDNGSFSVSEVGKEWHH